MRPGTLGPISLPGRIIKAATFEGMTPGGHVSDELIAHHRTLAEGGVALTTVAYGAVERGGRTFRDQLWLRPDLVPELKGLTRAVHEAGGRVALQLTHCGFFSKVASARGHFPRGPSWTFNAYGAAFGRPVARAMDAQDLTRIAAAYEEAADLAVEAGFDAVEIHLGHGYLLSQFLSPATNRRRDRYGGDRAARARYPLEIVSRVSQRIGKTAGIVVKLNGQDGFRGGVEPEDAQWLAPRLEAAGTHALVVSGGFTSRNALFLLRGGRPLDAMIRAERNPTQRVALRVLGPKLVQDYPFEETYFWSEATAVRKATRIPVALLGGVVSRANVERALDDGFAFVAMGRALIADPDLPRRMDRGELDRTRCNACNECIVGLEHTAVQCVLPDPG